MSVHRLFCYICKRHVECRGETHSDALKEFHACGHSSQKVRALRRGLIGVPAVGNRSAARAGLAADVAA